MVQRILACPPLLYHLPYSKNILPSMKELHFCSQAMCFSCIEFVECCHLCQMCRQSETAICVDLQRELTQTKNAPLQWAEHLAPLRFPFWSWVKLGDFSAYPSYQDLQVQKYLLCQSREQPVFATASIPWKCFLVSSYSHLLRLNSITISLCNANTLVWHEDLFHRANLDRKHACKCVIELHWYACTREH